jgi:hypothetical protein
MDELDTQNVLIECQMEEDKDTIFELALEYTKFNNELNNIEDNLKKGTSVYIISKEFIDEFKKAIKYEEVKDLLVKNNKDNLTKFKENLKSYSYKDLYSILCADIKFYTDLDVLEEDISNGKGIDFVNINFLNKLKFEENLDDYVSIYFKHKNSIMVVLEDKSKLLISKEGDQIKYHGIGAPFENKNEGQETLRRIKTISYLSNIRSKNRRLGTLIPSKSKTINN